MKIILASASPRRKELLSQINIPFEVIVSNVEEKIELGKTIYEKIEQLAYIKAQDVYENTTDDSIIIGADTVVYFNNQILGKPKDEKDAFDMLNNLQGNTCEVISGVCVIMQKNDKKEIYKTHDKCIVKIQQMSEDEIHQYIKTGEPLDKAGAFAIQGIGAKYIESIQGDYYSVVGLPVNKLYNILKKCQEE